MFSYRVLSFCNVWFCGSIRYHSTTTWQDFTIFWPLPPHRVDSFYTLSVDKNIYFLAPSSPPPPHLVHVVIEWPLCSPMDPLDFGMISHLYVHIQVKIAPTVRYWCATNISKWCWLGSVLIYTCGILGSQDCTKGRKISKANYVVLISFKKVTKYLRILFIFLQKWEQYNFLSRFSDL